MAQQLLRPRLGMLCGHRRRAFVSATACTRRNIQLHTLIASSPIHYERASSARPVANGRFVPRSTPQNEPQTATDPAQAPAPAGSDNHQLLFSIGIAALWIGLLAYAFLLSPNQTPYRDQIFLERLVGLGEKDGFVVNPVFTALFNLMGVYPAVYAALLVPAGRSENKIPAWPFVALSFFFGAFALLPYMALWRPYGRPGDNPLPPPAAELTGWRRLFMRGAETPAMPALLLAGSCYCFYLALSSDSSVWLDYVKLFDESRFVHVTSLDFATLTALAPFWMENDAAGRSWDRRSQLLPVLSLLPVIGPCIYLLLRPKAQQPK